MALFLGLPTTTWTCSVSQIWEKLPSWSPFSTCSLPWSLTPPSGTSQTSILTFTCPSWYPELLNCQQICSLLLVWTILADDGLHPFLSLLVASQYYLVLGWQVRTIEETKTYWINSCKLDYWEAQAVFAMTARFWATYAMNTGMQFSVEVNFGQQVFFFVIFLFRWCQLSYEVRVQLWWMWCPWCLRWLLLTLSTQ